MASTASAGRRRRGWGTLFCFVGSQQGATSSPSPPPPPPPWERARRRRKKRTVPVDGGLVGTAAAGSEVMRRGGGSDEESSRRSRNRKGPRLPGCCFFAPPPRAPGREHSAVDSSGGGRNKQRHPERTEPPPLTPPRSQSGKNSPPEASRIQVQATGVSAGNSSRGAEQSRSAPPAETTTTRAATPTSEPSRTGAGGVGAFGPVVGLSVAVAVSMAGLLGGRLWAVACVCTWLAALSRLGRTRTTAPGDDDGADQAAVDVDSTDHKEQPVLLRGLLQRDRRKAVAAA